MIDDAEIVYTETLDEALAIAFDGAPDGCIVTVHDENCDADEDGDGCTCEPEEYTVGARA